MSCDISASRLPQLQVRRPGDRFNVSIGWACDVATGETIADYAVDVVRKPTDAPDIIDGEPSHTDDATSVWFLLPGDVAPGLYMVEDVVTFSTGRIVTQCWSVLVETC